MHHPTHFVRGFRVTSLVATCVCSLLGGLSAPTQAQVAVGQQEALAAPIAPLNAITVPDVNVLGLLDKTGPGANNPAWPKITNPGKQVRLQQLGKAWFWDMQVGGDGIEACASCHYHAGADNRKTNQMSPGVKRAHGGEDPAVSFDADNDHEVLAGPNQTLTAAEYSNLNQNGQVVGFAVDEAGLIAANAGIDLADQVNGTPGLAAGVAANGTVKAPTDKNDVASSQGVRLHTHTEITCFDTDVAPAVQVDCDDPAADVTHRTDTGALQASDPGFNTTFSDATSSFTTSRRVEPRNSPTALNAVYHLRNFWDGRADAFFNGVNPLGFRDPDARVKAFSGGSLQDEKLRIPFSSLASQAVGPIESDFEMVWAGRLHRELGKKLLRPDVVPLAGQAVAANDSLLGSLRDASGRGLAVPANHYESIIREVFDQRFWGNGSGADVCLDASGNLLGTGTCTDLNGYRLIEWNFSLFFGLAVQAYEAILTTEQTIVDLLVGGVATGQVINRQLRRNGRLQAENIVPVAGLPLNGCIALAAFGNNAAAQAAATALCTQHYAQFIHPKATAGSQASDATAGLVAAGEPIGGCATPLAETVAVNGAVQTPFCGVDIAASRANLLAIDRGIGRFFAGATGCGICHFNPEFTGATVAALTGFGAAPPPPLPPGQLARIPPELPMERMIAFNGAPAVYDSGFYNLGVRPTPEDLSLGEQIGGVPLAFSKLAELINGAPTPAPYDATKINAIAAELAVDATTGLNQLLIPISPVDLSPRPFLLDVACAPGLVGNGGPVNGPNAGDGGGAANNPIPQCNPAVIVGERLLRNGAFKAADIRNAKLTGPYMHNGSKMTLQQVVHFYQTEGHFPTLNFNNLDAGLRIFDLGVQDTAALVEMMETGLTDWRVVHEEGKFDHPELCVPNGHDPATGKTVLAGIPAVGSTGSANPLTTFEDIVTNNTAGHEHSLTDPCTVPGIHTGGFSDVDEQPPML